jgi:hypothetical protein
MRLLVLPAGGAGGAGLLVLGWLLCCVGGCVSQAAA